MRYSGHAALPIVVHSFPHRSQSEAGVMRKAVMGPTDENNVTQEKAPTSKNMSFCQFALQQFHITLAQEGCEAK